jgi:hypothetical protein
LKSLNLLVDSAYKVKVSIPKQWYLDIHFYLLIFFLFQWDA